MELQNYGPGRPSKKETIATLNKMLAAIEKEPGIPSAKLARSLKLDSLRCAVLARRLRDKDLIEIDRIGTTLIYTRTQPRK